MIQGRNLALGLKNKINGGAAVIPGMADEHTVYSSATGAPYLWKKDKMPADHLHSGIQTAHDAAVTLRNDVVHLTPENHSLAASLTWTKSLTHLIGEYGPGMMNQRARIGHSANFASMIAISGYGNTFANLYYMHGRGSATNMTGLNITGNRNTFYRNHIAGPLHTTEGDEADYTLVQLDAAETNFEKCFFGIDTTLFTGAGCLVKFGNAAEPPRSTFKDCIFVMNSDAADPFFLNVEAGAGAGIAIFQNCLFINIGTSLTYAINGAGLGNFEMFFDINCSFAGVDDVVALAYEAYVHLGHGGYVSADLLNNGLATVPDVS